MYPRRHHPLLTLLLALALSVSGLAQGHAATGVPAGAMEVVICADGVAQSVFIDANGAPVDPDPRCMRELCPDCVPVKAGALTAAPAQPGRPLARRRAVPRPVRTIHARRRPQAAQPRAPPTKA